MKSTTLISILYILFGITCCIFVFVFTFGEDGEYAAHHSPITGRLVYAVIASAGVAFALSGFTAYGTGRYSTRYAWMFISLFIGVTLFSMIGFVFGHLEAFIFWLLISTILFGCSFVGGKIGIWAGLKKPTAKSVEHVD